MRIFRPFPCPAIQRSLGSLLLTVLCGATLGCSQAKSGLTARKSSGTASNTTATVTLSSAFVVKSSTATFTASGGYYPYTYSVVAGGLGGTINASTGVYTAPAVAGTDTIRATDAFGNTTTATVTVGDALALSGQSAAGNRTVTFAASGGGTPYAYAVVAGGLGGTINATTGVYTAPATAGSDTIQVTDAYGNTATATATVTAALSLTGGSVMKSTSRTFAATGGTAPYTYSISAVGAGGSVAAGTGVYTAPAATGSDVLRVSDADGATATATITVTATLTLTGGTSLMVSQTATVTAAGGVGAYTYSVVAGGAGGTVSAAGVYTAPAAVGSGTDTVRVTDSLGNTATTTMTVTPALSLSVGTSTVLSQGTTTLTASGGAGGYTYSVVSGSGTLSGTTYTAPFAGTAGTVTLRVTDAIGATATTTLTYKKITQWLDAGAWHTCRISAGATAGQLQCWGYNAYGQLGDGTTTDRATATDIDTGNLYTAVATGGDHSCAIQASGSVLCWGYNLQGEIGDGTTTSRSAPTLVNDTATYSAISAGTYHTCGITTTGVLKCWGYNANSQLGDGTTTTSSSPVTIDSGTSYAAVSAGYQHTCAITTAGVLKCWGYNANSQLGDGSTTNSTRPEVINAGQTYQSVATGFGHTCGVTTAGVLKCWGLDTSGQLGDGAHAGTVATPKIINSGIAYTAVAASAYSSCGILTTGSTVKCWGRNANYETGTNDTASATVDAPTATTPAAGTTFGEIAGGKIDITAMGGGLYFFGIGQNAGSVVWNGWGQNTYKEAHAGDVTANIASPLTTADP